MEVLSWDGTISSRDFEVAARAFAENWKQYNPALPPWTWQPSRLSQEKGYLSLEKICLLESKREHEQEDVDEQEPEPVDTATLVSCSTAFVQCRLDQSLCIYILFLSICKVERSDPQVCYYDFHIVYSDSYRVPVLYFRGYYIGMFNVTVFVFYLDFELQNM